MRKTVKLNSGITLHIRNKVALLERTSDPAIWKSIPMVNVDNEWIPIVEPDLDGTYKLNSKIHYNDESGTYDELSNDVVNTALDLVYDVPFSDIKQYYIDLAIDILKSPTNELGYISKKLKNLNYSKDDLIAAIRSILTGRDMGASPDIINALLSIEAQDSRIDSSYTGNKDNTIENEILQRNQEEAYGHDLETFKSDEDASSESIKEDNQRNDIKNRVLERIKKIIPEFAQKIRRYEEKKNMTLTENQILKPLLQFLNKNDIAGGGTPAEKKEELLTIAYKLVKEENARYKEQSAKNKKLFDYVNSHPKLTNKNIATILHRNNMDERIYYDWVLNNSEEKASLEKASFFMTLEDLIKLGFTEKMAVELSSLPDGEEKELVDESSGEKVNIKKVPAKDGEELYIVDDNGEKKALKPDSPEVSELQEGTVEVED